MSSRRTISNTFTVNTMDEPVAGPRGKTGRFYYYAQEWSNNPNVSYSVTDAEAPYFKYNGKYWVFNPDENYPNGISMSAMGKPSSNNSKWQLMTNDFKYIITQAIFGKYAQFGSFVINGDWLICTNGTINGTAYNTTDINNPSMYNGAAAYTWFDPAYPWSSINSTHSVDGKQWSGYNFVPNFAVNGLTGDTYQNNAHIKGHIEATSGSIGGFIIDPDRLYNSNWNAGVDIIYDNKTVKIGKNAKGGSFVEDAIIRAENTKVSVGSHNTALYLNASGATYNYAFYGNGNGVLNGLMFGYKTSLVNVSNTGDAVGTLNLTSGATFVISGVGGNHTAYPPTLAGVRLCLGLSSSSTTPFSIEIEIINQTEGNVHLRFRNYTGVGSEYPYLMSPNGNTESGGAAMIELTKGAYLKLRLTYTTLGYRAHRLVYNHS